MNKNRRSQSFRSGAALAVLALSLVGSACEGSFDKEARLDLRNAALFEEVAFAQNVHYVTCSNEECEARLPAFRRSSPWVQITMTASTDGRGFTGTAKHSHGRYTWVYDSEKPMRDQPTRK
jgi:hypothetical protein